MALPITSESAAPRHGIWFDAFRLGQTITSHGRTITETDIVLFAGLSADYTALHTDHEYARKSPYRRPIAHGMLVQSIASGLGARTGIFDGTIAALFEMEIRWLAPVFSGDTLHLVLVVSRLDPEPSRRSGKVWFHARLLNQKGEMVTEGTWGTLILRQRRGQPSIADPGELS